MKVYYSPRKVLIWLLRIFVALLILNIIGMLCYFNYDNRFVPHLYNITSFNSEDSIPTLYSTVLLLAASVLLFFIYFTNRGKTYKNICWLLLSLFFLYMSIDESISIHERFVSILRDKFNFSGLLYYSWVVPYAVLALILAIGFIPFLIKLEKKTRNLFILSGALFVSGAIGVELFGGRHYEQHGLDMVYAIFYTIEESLEILGISLFIFALLRYISIMGPKKIRFKSKY